MPLEKENPNEWRPRFSVDISEELYNRAQKCIPWGVRTSVINVIVSDLCDLIESKGGMVLGALLARALHLEDYVKMKGETNESLRAFIERTGISAHSSSSPPKSGE